jgi:hypothetical protein
LCLVQESITIRILLIILTHYLKRKKPYQIYQYDQYNRPSKNIFALFKIKILLHNFSPPTISAQNTQSIVANVLAKIFIHNTFQWKNEKVSIHKNMVQNKALDNNIYFKKAGTPSARIPGSKSSSTSRNVTNRNSEVLKNAKQVNEAAFIPGVLQNISTTTPKKNPHRTNSLRLARE